MDRGCAILKGHEAREMDLYVENLVSTTGHLVGLLNDIADTFKDDASKRLHAGLLKFATDADRDATGIYEIVFNRKLADQGEDDE